MYACADSSQIKWYAKKGTRMTYSEWYFIFAEMLMRTNGSLGRI